MDALFVEIIGFKLLMSIYPNLSPIYVLYTCSIKFSSVPAQHWHGAGGCGSRC